MQCGLQIFLYQIKNYPDIKHAEQHRVALHKISDKSAVVIEVEDEENYRKQHSQNFIEHILLFLVMF